MADSSEASPPPSPPRDAPSEPPPNYGSYQNYRQAFVAGDDPGNVADNAGGNEAVDAPPGYEDTMALPPNFDDVVYDWCFNLEDAGSRDSLLGNAGGSANAEAMLGDDIALDGRSVEALRRRVGMIATAMLIAVVSFLVVGRYVGRDFGVFSVVNVGSTLVFAIGAALLFRRLKPRQVIMISQLYFIGLWATMVVGGAFTLVFFFTIRKRVREYSINATDSKGWLTVAILIGTVTGFLVFTAFFSHLSRQALSLAIAEARVYLNIEERSLIPLSGTVRKLGSYIPNYRRIWNKAMTKLKSLLGDSRDCLVTCCCFPCVALSNNNPDACVWGTIMACLFCFLISVTCCIAATGWVQDVGCGVSQVMVEMLAHI